jgi:stage II sporulation protein AA (anti-sigma F factor antagonist)
MHLTSYLQDGTLTIFLTGEIDHHCAKHYIQSITSKIEAYKPQICVLDFQEVTFMDSSGIAVVINTLRNIAKIEGKLEISGLNPQPLKVFQASGIEKIVNIKEEIK